MMFMKIPTSAGLIRILKDLQGTFPFPIIKKKNISYKSEIMINLLQSKEKGTFIKNCKDNHDTDTTKNHYRRYKIKCE